MLRGNGTESYIVLRTPRRFFFCSRLPTSPTVSTAVSWNVFDSAGAGASTEIRETFKTVRSTRRAPKTRYTNASCGSKRLWYSGCFVRCARRQTETPKCTYHAIHAFGFVQFVENVVLDLYSNFHPCQTAKSVNDVEM